MDNLTVDNGLVFEDRRGHVVVCSDDGIDSHHVGTLDEEEAHTLYEWLGRWLLQRMVSAAALVLFFLGTANAQNISLSWNVTAGATSYVLYQSLDKGATWTTVIEVNVPLVVVNAPEGQLVLYKVSAKNALGESQGGDRGAWFNSTWTAYPTHLSIQ